MILNTVLHDGGFDIEVESEFRKHIRRTAFAGDRAVAVFCHRNTCARGDHCRSRGNIERDSSVAARSDHIDHIRSPAVDECRVTPEHPRAACQFGKTFPFHAQSRQQSAGLGAGGVASGHEPEHFSISPLVRSCPASTLFR